MFSFDKPSNTLIFNRLTNDTIMWGKLVSYINLSEQSDIELPFYVLLS